MPDASPRRHWLFTPRVEFLTLGSGSFGVLRGLGVFYPRDEAEQFALAGVMLILAQLVNHLTSPASISASTTT